jgi:hypothetical protein
MDNERIAGELVRIARDLVAEVAHDLEEGDILYSSWGYDQTNVDFYEVVKVLAKSVVIRKIAQKVAKSHQTADYVVPVPGRFEGPAMTKRVSPRGGVKIKSYAYASPWDGKPKYQTGWGFGH